VPDDPVPLPPRPPAPTGGAFADRLARLRRDPKVAAAALLLGACAAGVFWFRAGIATPTPASGAAAGPTSASTAIEPAVPSTTSQPADAPVVVHVAGAVAKPGVVTLRRASRVVDAIDAAGGPLPDADLDRLNLAAPVEDGMRVAVPLRGQPAPPLDAASPSGSTAETADGDAPAGPINLNTASLDELESLPGIGPTLAQAIIDERERSGGFRSVADLRRVRGIGDARFAQVEPLVTV
jgi:competence protein ComEA